MRSFQARIGARLIKYVIFLGACFAIFETSSLPDLLRSIFAQPIYLFENAAELEMPFAAGVSGAKASGQLTPPVKDIYSFSLRLRSKKGSEADRNRVEALSGLQQVGNDGNLINNPPLAVPIRLKVSKINRPGSQQVVFDKQFDREVCEGNTATDFFMSITGVVLDAATYKVEVESLEDVPALHGTEAVIVVLVRSR